MAVVVVCRQQRAARARSDHGAGPAFRRHAPPMIAQTFKAQATTAAAVAITARMAHRTSGRGRRRGRRWAGAAAGAQLGLLAGPVLVVGVLLHVQLTQSLSFGNVRSPLLLRQRLPAFAQPLRDLGVVHVRLDFANLAPLNLRPNHKGIHWPLDVVGVVFLRLHGGKEI